MKLNIFTEKNKDTIWNLLTLSFYLLLIWALVHAGLTYGIKNIFVNNLIKCITSPNEYYKAVVFIRNGGALTDFSPQVSLLKADEEFDNNHIGNVFIGYGNQFIDIYWENNTTLVVVHNCSANDIIMQEDEINDIKIIYKVRS